MTQERDDILCYGMWTIYGNESFIFNALRNLMTNISYGQCLFTIIELRRRLHHFPVLAPSRDITLLHLYGYRPLIQKTLTDKYGN